MKRWLVVAIALGLVFLSLACGGKEKAATALYQEAVALEQKHDWTGAIAKLQRVRSDFGETKIAAQAKELLEKCQIAQEDARLEAVLAKDKETAGAMKALDQQIRDEQHMLANERIVDHGSAPKDSGQSTSVSDKCRACGGSGKVRAEDGKIYTCPACGGSGY